MVPFPNPVRLLLLGVGLALSKVGLISEQRAREATDLSWPRIVTGLARMSKNAADVAMVGVALGPAAIAGVGFASPYWGLAFSVGGGLAAGTIALVSQRYGAEAYDQLGLAVRASAVLVTAITLPITAAFWLFPGTLIGVLSSDPQITDYGTQYLRIVGLGVPFAALNLVGSRVLVGVNDARTAMYVRGGGAVANVCLNAVLIFGLGMGVTGAAVGTVLANVLVTASFVVGLVVGRLPLVGAFPITVSPVGRYVDAGEFRDLVDIGLPVVGRNSVWTVARFPLLAIVGMFGGQVVAAYVISRRVLGLMNTPGWGFGLAASSLVGQALGAEDEAGAAAYGREVTRFAVATYVVAAALAAAFAEQLVVLFVDDPSSASVPVAVLLVYAAAGAVIFQGVNSTISGALDATGDTNWPFYSRLLGMFGVAIPLTYLGATTPLGLWGLVLAFFAETTVPAAINYYRFSTGKWKRISRGYRPDAAPADD